MGVYVEAERKEKKKPTNNMVQRSLGRIKLCDMMESLGSYLRQIRKGSPLKCGDVNA